MQDFIPGPAGLISQAQLGNVPSSPAKWLALIPKSPWNSPIIRTGAKDFELDCEDTYRGQAFMLS